MPPERFNPRSELEMDEERRLMLIVSVKNRMETARKKESEGRHLYNDGKFEEAKKKWKTARNIVKRTKKFAFDCQIDRIFTD